MARTGEDAAHRPAVELGGEVEQPAALGHHRPPRAHECRDLGAQPFVRLEVRDEDLREATGQDQRAGVLGQLLVAQRVEGPKLRARGLEQLEVLAIVERECSTGGDRDASAGDRPPGRIRPPDGPVVRRRGASQALDGVEVDIALRGRTQRGQRGARLRLALVCRHEAEMALRRGHAAVAAQRPEHGDAEVGERLAEELLVVIRADAVEDHAGHPDVGIEGAIAVHDRGRRARHRGGVHDQQHGRVQQLRDVSGRGQLTTPRGAVEESHDAFHDCEVGALLPVPRERRNQLGTAQKGVEVAPRPSGGERVVARIDVVGPDLEALHDAPSRAQRADQAAGHGGLPGARARARDDDAGDHGATTRCPAARGCRHPSGA